jgi:PIN domain nuclease of toxin-antitoxin system
LGSKRLITLDTCALIFDALFPEKLSAAAKKAINNGEKKNQLFCSDICLWEIAMLIQKKRLEPGTDTQTFMRSMLEARQIQVLGISLEIAALSAAITADHFDLADRIIAATAIQHNAELVTSDKKLHRISALSIIW